jgi:hypothetical protein
MIANNYRYWKINVLVAPSAYKSATLQRSIGLLREDSIICRIFFSVLRMIQLLTSDPPLSPSTVEELECLLPGKISYRSVLARRALEQKKHVQEEYVRMDGRSQGETTARIRLQQRNVMEPTFRDVVEEFAKSRGVLFQPRMGSNALKDGKQVYLFGTLPVYLEGDVVFCYKDSTWKPISLDRLVEMAVN